MENENKNKKSLCLKIIICVVIVIIVVGLGLCVKYAANNHSNGDSNGDNNNGNNYLVSKHKLIDYRINNCFETSDGIICSATDFTKNYEETLIKISDDNKILWKKSVYDDKSLNERSTGSILSCDNGGSCVFASGYSNTPLATEQGLMILFDSDGNKVWETNFDEHYIFIVDDIEIVEDGIVIIGSYRDKNENYKGFVFKYDLNGKMLWEAKYNENDGYGFNSLAVSSDGNIYVAGYVNSSNSSVSPERGLLIKINKLGQIVWDKSYKDDQVSSMYNDILINITGEIIVLGTRDKAEQNVTQQSMLLSYNSDGDEVSEHIYLEEAIEKIYLSKQNRIIGYGIREENKYTYEDKQIMILNINDDFSISEKNLLDITTYEFIIDIVEDENNFVIMALTKESDDKTAIIRIKKEKLFNLN